MKQITELLPEVLNRELQKQGSNDSKSGDQVDFEIAISNDRIINTPVERLKEVLRLVMLKIGLRAANIPKDEEKFVLIQHIIQHYGGHTPEEILLAFDMAIAGKLEAEVNCYENFSCLYVSTIMNAYRSWAKDQHKEIKMIEEPKLEDITNQDWYNQTKDLVRNRKLTVEFVPLPLYDWAIKEELMQPTTAQKWEYLKMATEYRQSKLYANVQMDSTKENNTLFSEFMRMKREGFTGDEKERLISLSKKMILFDSMLSK